MKRNIIIFTIILGYIFTACNPNKDIYDAIENAKLPYNESFGIELEDADYTTIKNLALTYWAQNNEDSSIAYDVDTYKNFSISRSAADLIPLFLASEFVALDSTSSINVKYRYSPNEYDSLVVFEFEDGDYTAIGGVVADSLAFTYTELPETYLPAYLATIDVTPNYIWYVSCKFWVDDMTQIDTSLVYETLLRYGIEKDLASVLVYEEDDHFRCFNLEVNPSISANIHVLGALAQTGLDGKNSSVQKVLSFLQRSKDKHLPFWADKWHSSPYYATSHAIIACANIDNDLVAESVDWILKTQNRDGSWGTYLSTAEETAYAIQALWTWDQKVASIPNNVLKNGARWLKEHIDDAYPPLWIGKCLYSPNLVIRSAIISALALAE